MSSSSEPGRHTRPHALLRCAAVAASSLVLLFFSGGCQDLAGLRKSTSSNCWVNDHLCTTNLGTPCQDDKGCGASTCVHGFCRSADKIAAGGDTTCAILKGGVPWCWGSNIRGQCGQIHELLASDGEAEWIAPSVQAAAAPILLPHSVTDVSVGGDGATGHACALTDGGEVWCWGASPFSEAGTGHGGEDWVIPNRIDLPDDIARVERVLAGQGRTCILARTWDERNDDLGRLWCWGENSLDQTLPGGWKHIQTPSPIMEITSVIEVALGRDHTCALTREGLSCWGKPAALPCGEPSGNGMITVSLAGITASGGVEGIRSVAAGDEHTCVATDTGVHCWEATPESSCAQPVVVPPLEGPATTLDRMDASYRVVAAGEQTCVSWTSGEVQCWRHDHMSASKLLKGLHAQEIAVGSLHACVREEGAQIRCWGDNAYGQLGQGSPDDDIHEEPEKPVKYYDPSIDEGPPSDPPPP